MEKKEPTNKQTARPKKVVKAPQKSRRKQDLKEYLLGKNIRPEIVASIDVKHHGEYHFHDEWKKIVDKYIK